MEKILNILLIFLILCLFFNVSNFFLINENFNIITPLINKIYYINLDRRPERNTHFLDLCKKHNLDMTNIKRFTGIDGMSYNFSKDEYNMFKNADFKNTDAATKIMGNQLSHYYILKEMIDNNYKYILIFQDDVIFRDDFVDQINNLLNYIPNDAEIINFGFHKTSKWKDFEALDLNDPIESKVSSKKDINEMVCILGDNINPCSLAYLVTLNGAKHLVEYFNKTGFLRATDWNYTDYLVSKNINYATKTILCTGNHKFESDIFK